MLRNRLLLASILLWPVVLGGQGSGIDPAHLLKPLVDSWPSYSGDYSGKRYSALTQVNRLTVKNLTLAWTVGVTPGPGNAAGGRGRVIVGGEGAIDLPAGGGSGTLAR